MKKEVIITAKTVEEAVALAVEELGAPDAASIEYTVLEEAKKGLFGIGAQNAKISACYNVGGEVRAFDFVKQLICDMGIEAEVSMEDGEDGAKKIIVCGEDAAVLIGNSFFAKSTQDFHKDSVLVVCETMQIDESWGFSRVSTHFFRSSRLAKTWQ